MADTIIYEGFMKKKPEKGIVRLWKNRYFILKGNAQLYYFLSKDSLFHKGCIDMNALESVELDDSNGYGFNLHLPKRIYYLLANNPTDRDDWLRILGSYQKGKQNYLFKLKYSLTSWQTSLILFSSLGLNISPKSFTVKCNASNLDRKDGPFQKSDPFFVLYTEQTNIAKSPLLYKSEIIAQHLSPSWEAFVLDVDAAGGIDAPLRFECYDYDNDGTTDYIGFFETTLSRFAATNAEFHLINPRKQSNPFYKHSGKVVITSVIPNYPAKNSKSQLEKETSARAASGEALNSSPTITPTPTPQPTATSSPNNTQSPLTSIPETTTPTPSEPAKAPTPEPETPAPTPTPTPTPTPAANPAAIKKESSVATNLAKLIKQLSTNNGRILDLSRTKHITQDHIRTAVSSDPGILLFDIKRINASDVKAMDNALLEWIVTQVPNLTHIDLHWCDHVSGKGVVAISEHCPDLTNISLGCCSKVSASSVAALVSKCTKLKILDLNWVWNVNDETIDVVSKSLTILEELTLSGCQHLGDKALYSLANLKSLKVIDLSRCEKLGTEAILHLASSLPKLETLILLGIDSVKPQWADTVFAKQFPTIVTGFSL